MITTNYVWTAKAERDAKERGLETRMAGQAACFAYQPLEKSPITVRAWLEIGEIRRVEKPVTFLNFHSKRTSEYLHVDATKFFNENGIPYRYANLSNGELEAAIIDDEFVPVTFHHLDGDCYMITEKDAPLDMLFNVAEG